MSVLFIISSHIYRPSLLYFAPNFACIVFLHNSITKSPIIENFANIVWLLSFHTYHWMFS